MYIVSDLPCFEHANGIKPLSTATALIIHFHKSKKHVVVCFWTGFWQLVENGWRMRERDSGRKNIWPVTKILCAHFALMSFGCCFFAAVCMPLDFFFSCFHCVEFLCCVYSFTSVDLSCCIPQSVLSACTLRFHLCLSPFHFVFGKVIAVRGLCAYCRHDRTVCLGWAHFITQIYTVIALVNISSMAFSCWSVWGMLLCILLSLALSLFHSFDPTIYSTQGIHSAKWPRNYSENISLFKSFVPN